MPDLSLSTLIALAVILLVGFPVHEAAHAYVAHWLGDDTAKRMGRLTLNPLKHLDVLGSIMLIVTQFIGWAKPVPVSPWQLRYGPRVGGALVAGAGPASNLIMAVIAAALYRVGLFEKAPAWVTGVIFTFVGINIILFLFNLIPLGPLDGYSVLSGLAGERVAAKLTPLKLYGPQILMGLLLVGFLIPGFNVLARVLGPLMNFMMRLLLGG